MDSPLNKAHQHVRKSESLIKSGKYTEAVECHVLAAECILQAMTLTTSSHALESLKLQHQYHLKQTEYLQQRIGQVERNQSKRLSKGDNHVNKECQTDNTELNIFDAVNDDVGTPIDIQDNVYQTMTETDTLLNFLEKRTTCLATTSGIPAKINSKVIVNNYTKQPKSTQTIIEELTIHNDNLRGHIEQLLNEIELLKKEKDSFKKLANNKIAERTISSEICETHFSQEDFYDLPPLEMPTLGPEFYDESGKTDKTSNDSLTCD